jgi:gliding motility-associated protein GldL
MAAKKSVFFDKILPSLYSVGAAVVIFGAWAKILHKDFADIMLTVGLLTEALIFLTFAFQSYFQESSEYQWEKVYPELDPSYTGAAPARTSSGGGNALAQLDANLSSAQFSSDTFSSLKTSIQKLGDSVKSMNDVQDATLATQEYSKNIKSASQAVSELGKAYSANLASVNDLSVAASDAKEYRNQVSEINKKMSALNAAYELEINDTKKQLQSLNSMYSNLNSMVSNLGDAGKEGAQFKDELAKLKSSVTSLNSVYGNMLSAMKA